MYAVAPLGLGLNATNPWLPGSDVDPLVALAWLLLLGGPAAAAVLAARSCRDADGSVPYPGAAIRQGIAAGVLANLTGALLVTTLGTSTTALMLKSGTVRDWLYGGQHLSPLALYHQEVYDSTGTRGVRRHVRRLPGHRPGHGRDRGGRPAAPGGVCR